MENKYKLEKKENNQLVDSKKIQSQLDLLLKGQEINRDILYKGFMGLLAQNQELLELNKQLSQ